MWLHRWIPLTAMMLSISVGACSYPISPEQLAETIKGLAADHASACLQMSAGGGAGAIAIAPVPAIPAGGGGYGYLTACRSNQPGSEIEVKLDGSITIKHGIYGQEMEQKKISPPVLLIIPKDSVPEKNETPDVSKQKEAL